MATFEKLQRDFSGGEISQRMFMRDDLEVHGKACLTMENIMPSLQGTAVRTPGTRFLWDIRDAADNVVTDARIVPYITPNNNYSLVEIIPLRDALPGEIRIRQDIGSALSGIPASGGVDPDAPQQVFKRIVPNDTFELGLNNWTAVDEQYAGGDGDSLGVSVSGSGSLSIVTREGYSNKDNPTATVTGQTTIPEDTTQLQIVPALRYINNFTDVTLGKQTGSMRVGTTLGGNEIWEEVLDDYEVGDSLDRVISVSTVLTAGTTLYLTFTITALEVDGVGSTPAWLLSQFRILSPVTVDVNTQGVTLNNPVTYTPEELKELQYVQSPYFNSGDGGETFGNELVLIHPNHAPKRLYYNAGAYIFEDIAFSYVNEDGNVTGPATEITDRWVADGYPAACTSYMGRLVLAGSTKAPTLGTQTGSSTETVWMTYVGKWFAFSDPANTTVTPADSIEFASTYRSPIQWVHGQSNLLIGSESYEYVSNSDGIYSPSDLGVFLQSTHGSERVQPTPMGQYVLFAAEQGSRVRAMQYIAESEYWISPDMTLWHPDLFAEGGGIRRMARMRNPHQICACVMGNGKLAMLHQDSYANISAWSRSYFGGGNIQDIAVLPQDDGTDVMYLLIRRNIDGTPTLLLEALADWTYTEESNWNYTSSSVTFLPPAATNVITGLEHLEGKVVQVVSNQNYIGSWTVSGGTVTMLDGTGSPINVDNAVVGMLTVATLRTMPMITQDPSAKKRYGSLFVRCRNSGRPTINGKRPPDRNPITLMDEAQGLDRVVDYEDENFGWNSWQIVNVRETLPIKLEVMGIFGTVKSNSI